MTMVLNPILISEGGLTAVFFVLLILMHKRFASLDGALWLMVWSTRVFASLNGANGFAPWSPRFKFYILLQGFSALSLILIMMRSELRVLRHSNFRRILVQVFRS